MLIKIIKIVFAPHITKEMLSELKILIEEHHKIIVEEFKIPLIQKHHLITHLPIVIEQMSAPKSYWTMRYESKHGFFEN